MKLDDGDMEVYINFVYFYICLTFSIIKVNVYIVEIKDGYKIL